MKKYLIKAEKQTTYRLKTLERVVTCEDIDAVINARFRAYDAFLQSFFKTPNARILSIEEV